VPRKSNIFQNLDQTSLSIISPPDITSSDLHHLNFKDLFSYLIAEEFVFRVEVRKNSHQSSLPAIRQEEMKTNYWVKNELEKLLCPLN